MPRIYTLSLDAVAITTSRDLFQLEALSENPVAIHSVEFSQSTDYGNAEAEGLKVLLRNRITNAITDTSGEVAIDVGDKDFGGKTNTNQVATSTGAVVNHETAWNIQTLYKYEPRPLLRPLVRGGDAFTVHLADAPTDSITISGTVVFEELWGMGGVASLFPIVETTSTSSEFSADVTSHTVTLPSGIISGDLILLFFAADGFPFVTWPAGYTEILDFAPGLGPTLSVAYRQADGTEGANITVTTDNAERSAHIVYRISGQINPSIQAPEVSTGASGTSTAPNPASLTPTGGAKNYLWVASCGSDGIATVDGFPTNYINGLNVNGTVSTACSIGSAERDLNATSEDPGTFTLNISEGWVAATVAVHPALPGPAVEATNTSVEATVVTSHTVSLPAGLVSGDLLIVGFATSDDSVITTPTGWTLFANSVFPAASAHRFNLYYRQSDGGEGSSVAITTAVAETSAHFSYRISGHINPATQAPEAAVEVEGTSTAPNSGSLSPTGGSNDYLWLSANAHIGSSVTTDTFPTNYINTISTQTTGIGVGSCQRSLTVASEDPGAFALSASVAWAAFTIAVHPA